ncbi:plasmid IncI1-type surface exclusion protein ExcA [Pantoea sp. DY-17]|uniref:plasmid IncI1-type surface exclusion protein ExcA n=1 Tax=Pantoea sp. DY-17 TaxID=2871490 RepID=UPI001C970144|nr:plasmid IncI1-type surface exclusion protein ExcA [Pantoea sp. DY-17]MBY4954526.1 plasmid IncI1-type surface exclusion protein ExcA [Pantoea sp. DY-17]
MKSVQRHDSRVESFWVVIKFAYYFLALPCLMFIGIAMAFIAYGTATGKTTGADSQFYSVAIVVWLLAIVPLIVRRYGKVSRKRQLKQIATLLTSEERFSPQKQHQVLDAGRGKYLGVDTRHGNILYINMVKKGIVDVLGLTMDDWTDRELEGSTLRLNTKNPEVPVLSINAHPTVAKELFDTIGAMSHKSYSESFPQEPWPEYVGRQSRFVEFEHNVVVPQVV